MLAVVHRMKMNQSIKINDAFGFDDHLTMEKLNE